MQAFVRLTLLFFAAAVAMASSTSTTNAPAATPGQNGAPNGGQSEHSNPASSQTMDPTLLLGVWKSNFGPVKIQADTSGATGKLMGVWVYDRDGAEVIGYFSGAMRGNVLNFQWQEPSTGKPLEGGGYLQFDVQGNSYTGRWWTTDRDRGGDWNGWREQAGAVSTEPASPAPETTAPTTNPL